MTVITTNELIYEQSNNSWTSFLAGLVVPSSSGLEELVYREDLAYQRKLCVSAACFKNAFLSKAWSARLNRRDDTG